MYAYIKGIIKNIEPSHVVIENNGIGYLIIVPNPYLYKIEDDKVIYTHHYVKEDINNLYGFDSNDSKNLFLKLISVNGIGPKTALSILAFDNSSRIVNAIETSDVKYLTKFPGVGNKTASQIILDLKGKLTKDEILVNNVNLEDAELALISLGYSKVSVNKVLKDIDHSLPIDKIIKEALNKILN